MHNTALMIYTKDYKIEKCQALKFHVSNIL